MKIYQGDALETLKTLPNNSVHCVITSPPYYGQRDYQNSAQIGLERTPEDYLSALLDVFKEVWRVLIDDGVMWININDSYANMNRTTLSTPSPGSKRARSDQNPYGELSKGKRVTVKHSKLPLKEKDLMLIPFRLAIALQEQGWYVRNDCVWEKPNSLPETAKDRFSRSHEYMFLLTKKEKYYFNKDYLLEPSLRSVWRINAGGEYRGHAAAFPKKLITPCVLASTQVDDVILDPFAGSGTVGVVAKAFGRDFIGIELNSDYCKIAHERLANAGLPLLEAVEL